MTRKLFILNFAGLCLVAWAWATGFVDRVIAADAAHMWAVMCGLFAVGLYSAFTAARDLGKAGGDMKALRACRIRSEHLGLIAVGLFTLGIIGNAIGIINGFTGIDVNALGDADGVKRLGAQVLAGASATFGATIVGAALALWTMVNTSIIYTGTALLELEAE